MVVHTSGHNLSSLYLADRKWLHPIVIAFFTVPSAILHSMVCHTSLNSLGLILWKINLSLPWKLIFQKATKVGSPPNFSKLTSQLWGISEPQYYITLSLDSYWTYFGKQYINIYIKQKDPKFGTPNFGYQIWCCTRLLHASIVILFWWNLLKM